MLGSRQTLVCTLSVKLTVELCSHGQQAPHLPLHESSFTSLHKLYSPLSQKGAHESTVLAVAPTTQLALALHAGSWDEAQICTGMGTAG